MDQLRQLMGSMGEGPQQSSGGLAPDVPTNDNAETVYISSLALLKVSSLFTSSILLPRHLSRS